MTGMTLEEATARVIATDPTFAVTEAVVRGVRFRVFANAPGSLREMMERARAVHGEGDYLVHEGERWTFEEFRARTNRLAHALRDDLGVRPGDRVSVAMRNYPEMLMLMLAIPAIGAVVVFVNAWWTGEELEYGFADSGAKLVFADGPRRERIASFAGAMGVRVVGVRDGEEEGGATVSALLAGSSDESAPATPIGPDDDFAVMYSSGSTGHPKGVVLTHRGAISAVWTWLMAGELAAVMDDASLGPPAAPRPPAILIATPLFHITATHPLFLLSLPAGARIVLMRKWDADEAARLIEAEGITRFLGVPTMTADLMEAAARLGAEMPTLEYLGSGGAKRPPAQVDQLARAFPRAAIASGWGMTETNAVGIGIAGPDYEARPGAAGRLQPPLQDLRIVDDDGRELPTGEVGEITVKSPANMRCYLNKPEATDEALRDGWLFTGDLGSIDAEGWVTIVDRKKNIIIRGGENIACLDVEAALHRHPAVAEACAFAAPDARLGEVVAAAVQVRPGASLTAEALRAFLAEHVAGFKIPERIWLFEAPLTRGATDKIDRRALRAECLGREDAAA